MKFQACTYKTSEDAPRREGIARLNSGFGTCDVAYIIDGETGTQVPYDRLHHYDLDRFPLSHIDTSYKG